MIGKSQILNWEEKKIHKLRKMPFSIFSKEKANQRNES